MQNAPFLRVPFGLTITRRPPTLPLLRGALSTSYGAHLWLVQAHPRIAIDSKRSISQRR